MGHGEPELGRRLIKSFLSELAKSEVKIDVIGCVNTGINHTTKGSKVIDSLQELEKKGARIATCGSCLDYYNKKEQLLIGEVGTMDQTVQIMSLADRVIRPS
jgi:selenium metabolism protein YedF